MKVAIRCLACSKVFRLNKSYLVRIHEKTIASLTGEIKQEEVIGRVCRDCAESAGYKVRKAEE